MWHELGSASACILPPAQYLFFFVFLIWVTRRWRHKVVCPMPRHRSRRHARSDSPGVRSMEHGVALGDREKEALNASEIQPKATSLGRWVVRLPGRCFSLSFSSALWFSLSPCLLQLGDVGICGQRDMQTSGHTDKRTHGQADTTWTSRRLDLQTNGLW